MGNPLYHIAIGMNMLDPDIARQNEGMAYTTDRRSLQ